ncbi:MAG: FAD-dependent thymidylate synthase [Candidatus Colwellbacteria bacterium]|nr:FAD-dependent thymidylate synthase [Candidatus Colwellbacteria bacterium]
MPPVKNIPLKHARIDLESGAMVLVLDTGAAITPEAEAMLQALHSRSPKGVLSHLEILQKKGPENFMASFYVGYGHKSIGDCGTCTIFIEGVSMLVAKAIQDWMLYSGQESSTRYMDFSAQPFSDPLNTRESALILENWRKFYLEAQKSLRESLMQRYPKPAGEEQNIYEKAIAARSFDILRGFLPSGTVTNLAWHTNLRQAADKLMLLRHHPLQEVRGIARAVTQALQQMFPSSFSHELYEKTEEYNQRWMENKYYFSDPECPDFHLEENSINTALLSKYREALSQRPLKTDLPKPIAECGMLQFRFLLDFGSFRDIQRHRAVIQRMPLVTMDHGFEPWYLEELTDELRVRAEALIRTQKLSLQSLKLNPEVTQYYIPMGYRVPNRITGDLPALVYLVELRSTRFVHPTLQRRALQIGEKILELFAEYGLVLHLDTELGRFDTNRGRQDIVGKE